MTARRRGPRPEITVSMPAYEAAAFVGEALESVLRQSGVDLEVLVVDDGSSDDTAGIVGSFDDRRVTLIRNPERRGIGFCHNLVIDAARAPFIAHVDADDVLRRGALWRMLAFLHEAPDVGQAFSYFIPVDECGVTTPAAYRRWRAYLKGHRPVDADHRTDLLRLGMVANHLRTYRKSVFESVGRFDPDLDFGVDYEMALRIVDRFSLGLVPRFLYCRRLHGANTSEAMPWRAWRSWRKRLAICRSLMREGRVAFLRENPARTYRLLAASLLYEVEIPRAVRRLSRLPTGHRARRP